MTISRYTEKFVSGFKNHDVLVILFYTAFSLFLWWPSRFLPYFWDSSGYVVKTAQDLVSQNFGSLISLHTDFAHPPLVSLYLALFWKLFGESRWLSHIVMLPALPLYALSMYFFFKRYVASAYAFTGSVIVAFTAGSLAEYMNIYVDLPSAALAALALALSRKNQVAAMLSLSAAALIKIPVLTLLPFFVLDFPKHKRWLAGLPLAVAALWLLYHYQMTGWWLIREGRPAAAPANLSGLISSILYVLRIYVWDQGKFIWAIFVSIFIVTKRQFNFRSLPKHSLFPAIAGMAASLCFFFIAAEFAPRYGLYFLPFYGLITVWSLSQLQWKRTHSLLAIMIMLTGIIWNWKPRATETLAYDFHAPSDLTIIEKITVFRELALYLQLYAPNSEIYGGFPENQHLTESIQGYVSKPLNFKLCEKFAYNPKSQQLVVIHPYSPSQITCRQLMDIQQMKPVYKFQHDSKWIELYEVEASASATTKTQQ